MELEGKLQNIGDIITHTQPIISKREVTLITVGEFPQSFIIVFVQNECCLLNLLDSYSVGQNVKISFDLLGRVWANPEKPDKALISIRGQRIIPQEPLMNFNNRTEPILINFNTHHSRDLIFPF